VTDLDPADFALRDVVLREYLKADKAPDLTLQGCEAWLAAQSAGITAVWEAST
jgi:hypothetical protein